MRMIGAFLVGAIYSRLWRRSRIFIVLRTALAESGVIEFQLLDLKWQCLIREVIEECLFPV